MRLGWYYFGWDFLDSCPHLYCCYLKHNILAAVSSGLPQVSLVYLGIEMMQPGKLFLKLSINNNKDEENSPKSQNQNNTFLVIFVLY